MSPRRVLYWGGKHLGHRFLAHLVERARTCPSVEIAAVCVSERDIRKDAAGAGAIAALAAGSGVPVFTNRHDIAIDADVGLAVGYPHLIPADQLNRCRDGALNLHMGPLPHYRGAKTLVHAILNREARYGVSLHYMDATIDTGDVVAVRWTDLPDDRTAQQIMRRLTDIGFDLLAEHLPRILREGRLEATAQADLAAAAGVVPRYYTRSTIEPLFRLSPDWDFETLHRYTRALTTGGGAAPYLEERGRRLYLSIDPPARIEEAP